MRRAPNSKGAQQLEEQLHLLDMAATNTVRRAPRSEKEIGRTRKEGRKIGHGI